MVQQIDLVRHATQPQHNPINPALSTKETTPMLEAFTLNGTKSPKSKPNGRPNYSPEYVIGKQFDIYTSPQYLFKSAVDNSYFQR